VYNDPIYISAWVLHVGLMVENGQSNAAMAAFLLETSCQNLISGSLACHCSSLRVDKKSNSVQVPSGLCAFP